LHQRDHEGVIKQSVRFDRAGVTPQGYPEDIDAQTAQGAGKLKIKVRKED
jgi:hypothetical protein